MRGNRGFALVLTLVVTALMVAVLTELIHQVYVDTSLSRGFRDGQQASLLAESGITAGKKIIQLYFNGSYTAPFDIPTQEDEVGKLEITVIEESGKLNLNTLVQNNGKDIDPAMLDRLMRLRTQLKITVDQHVWETLWNALADWIDNDNIPRSNSVESPYYQTLKPPYMARNGRLRSVEELSLVYGFTPEIITLIKPFVTVYAEQNASYSIATSRININTAPLEVLVALDKNITKDMAQRVLEERQRNPFKSIGELSRISGFESLASQLQGYATVKGSIFRIISKALVKDSARTVEVVWRSSDDKILSWQEY
jgi:general secretion pathway protein K